MFSKLFASMVAGGFAPMAASVIALYSSGKNKPNINDEFAL